MDGKSTDEMDDNSQVTAPLTDFAGGAGLLIGLLYFMYQWSWHLIEDGSIESGKWKHLPVAASIAVFVSAVGASSSHSRLLFGQTPSLQERWANFTLFCPFWIFSISGYYFDQCIVNKHLGCCLGLSQFTFTIIVASVGSLLAAAWNARSVMHHFGRKNDRIQ